MTWKLLAIPATAATLPPLGSLAPRITHGDLKISNVLFADPVGDAATGMIERVVGARQPAGPA